MMRFSIIFLLALLSAFSALRAQTSIRTPDGKPIYLPSRVTSQAGEGLPIGSVILLVHKDGKEYLADSVQVALFEKDVNIYPGSIFNQSIADMAVKRINTDARVKSAEYDLYGTNLTSPVIMVINIHILAPGERKEYAGKSGMVVSGKVRDFPLLYENKNAELTLILNGGVGLYNEDNAFFSQGAAFTKGNPIADDPAGKGVRFWGEAYLEPGIAGIIQLGSSNIYAYGAVSGLFSGRNTADIYSKGGDMYADFERLYAGVLFTGLGKKQNASLSASYGRQFYQLNDGFLISKFSGSANAGPRASVYLNSRTTFQKTGLVKFAAKRWSGQAFYLEPEELFKAKGKQTNIAYAGGYVGYNDNKHWDVGFAYINRVGGKGSYAAPDDNIPKKGLNIINPKLWISNIGGMGIFFKSEYAYEFNKERTMSANGWYVGGGVNLTKVRTRPMFYYRYAFMQGDNPDTKMYTRFDPILTGGLGNWVQGINMRKVTGNGNIISHRLQAKINPLPSLEVSFDYFHLRSDTYLNLGALAPLSNLKSKHLGDELTLQAQYFLNQRFMLLGVASLAVPGQGIKDALPESAKNWTSVQLALFMFF